MGNGCCVHLWMEIRRSCTYRREAQIAQRYKEGCRTSSALPGAVRSFCGWAKMKASAAGSCKAVVVSPRFQFPPEATPVCSATGDKFAHFTSFPARRELPPPKDIYIGTQTAQSRVQIGGVVLAARFSPDAKYVY